MPRISEPTVAAHRAHQRATLVAAAHALLLSEGPAAVTPAAVGAQAGLARSSVYQYFSSANALLATVVEGAFPAWAHALEQAVAGHEDPREQVDAYVRTSLLRFGSGEHKLAGALNGLALPAACEQRLGELHGALLAPLVAALTALGVVSPGTTAVLINGAIGAAFALLDRGAPYAEVEATTCAFVRGAVT